MKKLFFSLLAAACALTANAQIEAGDYFIQNVETGTFLNGANDWGTKASVTKHGQKMTIAASGSGYTIDSHISNGGDSHYLAAGDNTYADGAAAAHTITALGDGIYSIKDTNNKYLVNNDGTKVNFAAANADANNAKWKFISMTDVATMMAAATVEKPCDATFYFGDANFSRNNQYKSLWKVSSDCTNKNLGGGNNDNMCAESYHSKFTISQQATVPNGVYAVTAQGFYRQDGSDNDNLPVFFANDETKPVPLKTGGENSMANASTSFSSGLYTIDPIYVQVTDGTLNIGIKNPNNTNLWVIWDNFELTYYGDVSLAEVLLAAYVADYKDAMAAANALLTVDMSDDAKTALSDAITANTVDLNNTTEEALVAATNALKAATEAAQKAADKKAYENKLAELIAQGEGTEITELLVNPGFELGNLNGWTNNSANGMWTIMTRANAADPKVGNYWIEKYGNGGKIDLSQTLTGLPAGYYIVSALALDQASKAKIIANDAEVAIVGGDKAVYNVVAKLDEPGDLKIGIYSETHQANSWVGLDDFHVTYGFPALTPASGVMNAEVEAAQTSALAAYNANKTYETYVAAAAAVEAANASVKLYADNKAALEAQKALIDGTNVYDAEGYAAYVTAYEAAAAAYEARTATTAVVNPSVFTGWHASTDYNFLLKPWKIGEVDCNNFDAGMYINTWSQEGDTDGTNFKVPFFEYWVGDGEKLANNTLSATVAGVENGIYNVTAWVRVRTTNGVTATDATGITFCGVDATEGTQVGTSQFTLAEVAAQVKVTDGTLKIAFDVKDANISWLSFKNVKYTKVADLPIEVVLDPVQVESTSDYDMWMGMDENGNVFYIGFDPEGNCLMADVEDAEGGYYSADKADFVQTKGENTWSIDGTFTYTDGESNVKTLHITASVTLSSASMVVKEGAQYATFFAPFDVTKPAGVAAYTVNLPEEGNVLELTVVSGAVIPANMAVVLESENAVNETFKGIAVPSYGSYGDLVGVLEDTTAPVGSYVLQNQTENGIGFYEVEGTKTVPANRCYLKAPAGARFFGFGEETAINAIDALTSGKAQIFDLNGRKLNRLQKGINIVNGVKILVK